MVPTFSRGYYPSDPADWPTYQKKVRTSALRIDGPFDVQTSEGLMHCEDGYLALDARGYPYPVAAAEFDLVYEA